MEESVIAKQIWPHCYITQLPKMPAPLCVCVRWRPPPLMSNLRPPMTYVEKNPRRTAALQTVCVCAAVEGLILIVLAGILNHSFIAAAVVSAGFLGPVSWWLAPAVYRRLLRASS